MTIGKRLRFEIFRRDNFACRYCGATAQSGAVLEVDHVLPRSRGGKDTPRNLLTACDACNSGKSDTDLTARLVDDVPQEAFRRACADRGLLLLGPEEFLPNPATRDGVLADEILAFYDEEIRAECLQKARDDLIEVDEEAEEPSRSRIADRAAYDAFWSTRLSYMNFAYLVDQLLELTQPFERLRDLKDKHGCRNGLLPGDVDVTIAVIKGLIEISTEEILKDLSAEETRKWIEYAIGVHGDDPWGRPPQEERRLAAQLFKAAVSEGLVYPGMCTALDGKKPGCPRRAEFIVTVDGCDHCSPDGPSADEGHRLCAEHAGRLQRGDAVDPETGTVFVVRTCTSVMAGVD